MRKLATFSLGLLFVAHVAAQVSQAVSKGGVVFIASGTCPEGFTEKTEWIGRNVLATTSAAGDAGTTGGSNSYTPQGSVAAPSFTGTAATLTGSVAAPSFTGTAETLTGSVAAPSFTGSQVTSGATSAGTPAGSNSSTATSGNCAATNIAAGTGSTTACKATAPNLTVPAETFTGSAMGTHTHPFTAAGTNSAPALTMNSYTPQGANTAPALTMNSYTPQGANTAPGFTGTQATITPPFVKLIPCIKN